MLSVLVVTVLVFVYNKLIDTFPKHQLFYIVGQNQQSPSRSFGRDAQRATGPSFALSIVDRKVWRALGDASRLPFFRFFPPP